VGFEDEKEGDEVDNKFLLSWAWTFALDSVTSPFNQLMLRLRELG